MADNNSRGEKIPLDAKESFLRSVRKKNSDNKPVPEEAKPAEVKEVDSQEIKSTAEDIPVLFDNYNEKEDEIVSAEKDTVENTSEIKEQKKDAEKPVPEKEQEIKKENTVKTEKEDKSDKDKSENKKKTDKKDKAVKVKSEDSKKSVKKDKKSKEKQKKQIYLQHRKK